MKLESKINAHSERIYYLPKYAKHKHSDIVVEYITFKLEPKEILNIDIKSLIEDKNEKFFEIFRDIAIFQCDSFQADSSIGETILAFDSSAKNFNSKVTGDISKSKKREIARIFKNNLITLKKELNLYTRGNVDIITYYYIKNNGEMMVPELISTDNKLMAFAMNIQKIVPNSVRYINYI